MTRFLFKCNSATALLILTALFCGCRTTPKPVSKEPPPARQMPPQIIEAPTPGYQIYLIIDDAGQRFSHAERFLNLPVPMTIAILPDLPATQTVAAAVHLHSATKELILHQPMQPISQAVNPGPGAIYGDTPLEEIPNILRNNMAQAPGAKGMNNHMGSLVTQDRARMDAVMAFCKANRLFFVDSFTTPESIAGQVAREHGVPTAQQYVFLDNDHDAQSITKQFKKGMRIAKEKGYVVMIGHAPSPETARVIEQMAQPAKDAGCSFHMISDVFRMNRSI